ncbi:N-lysine methyltransferase SMYD2 [Patagioenas fasciata monilis]|uniref:[histone H3]-lysine(4) N-trimethyltransferase n=1 Tax=Patagioenas fasciata monilis TaxID=372326 RepID=A0A1V4JJB9_PATFA|nr:N-lysine methyltransferase SMYD2 [Patagioenas fasciata monilis]
MNEVLFHRRPRRHSRPGAVRKEGLSKCGRCKQAFYCNVECQKEDWPMHKLECSAMCAFGQNWNPSETVRLTARILAKQKTHPERTQSEKLLAVKEFESHLDKLDNEKRELIQNDIAALHHFYSKHLEYPDNAALVVLFAQVNCNGFTIEDEELSHLGSAIFPDVALMNHSCCPNVIVTYKGTLAEVRAVKEIEPGEEVFTSYIDLLYPTEDRNDRLRDSYFFNCDCRECVTKEKDKEKLEIRKLSDPPSAETVRDMIKYARNVIEEFRRAKHYKSPSELLEICELSLDKMGAVFEDSNVYMLHMMYQAMGVCLYVQDWEGALRYGQKIIRPYSKHYPSYSLNVASMWLKLGRLYMALENRTAGVKALKRAIAIMEGPGGLAEHAHQWEACPCKTWIVVYRGSSKFTVALAVLPTLTWETKVIKAKRCQRGLWRSWNKQDSKHPPSFSAASGGRK